MSWERMTRLSSTGRPSATRRTAAEVSSQLVSMPRTRLVATEEIGHQAPVGGRAPGMLPDDFLHDHAVLVQQQALGDAGGLIDPLDISALVVEDVEGEPQLLDERRHVARVPVVDAHRDDPEAARSQLLIELLHRRHLGPAGNAPGGPDVYQGHLALAGLVQRDRILGAEPDRGVVGRPAAHFDALDLGAERHQRPGAEPEPEDDNTDPHPLLRVLGHCSPLFRLPWRRPGAAWRSRRRDRIHRTPRSRPRTSRLPLPTPGGWSPP